jgi:myo-inositol-1(or 4)-monophosphatase
METLNNLSVICEAVCKISRDVGKFIRLEQSRLTDATVEEKGVNDFVTYVDKAAESLLVRELNALLPEAGFLTEENTVAQEEKEFRWIIDPIDGTTNFIHGLPLYSISIALMHNQRTVLGVVYELSRDECFHAITGRNAYLNTTPIHVSKRNLIKDSLLVTGFPYKEEGILEEWVSLFTYFIRNSHGIRRLGSAAIDLAYVACGRFEAFYENGLAPWDVAAGAFIVQQADGIVSDFYGGENYIFGRELVAGNGYINNELLTCIHSKVSLNK